MTDKRPILLEPEENNIENILAEIVGCFFGAFLLSLFISLVLWTTEHIVNITMIYGASAFVLIYLAKVFLRGEAE